MSAGGQTTTRGTPSTGARIRAAGVLARRALREPLVHFVIGGGLIFLLWSAVRPEPAGEGAGGDTPMVVERKVNIGPRDLELQRASFRAAWKRDPTPGELADLLETLLCEEMLYREGAALGLDRDDAVVRRRLIEKATALARPSVPAGEPTAAELRTWYEVYQHRFFRPAVMSFTQLYFDARKHGDPMAAATAARARLARRPAEEAPPADVGDSFVLPTTLEDRGETQVAHLFGEAFAEALAKAPVGAWHGPVRSNYGVHLVRVSRRQPARTPPFEEVEKHVRADWLTASNRGLRAAALALLPRYEVNVDPAVRKSLGDAPALAPFLRRARQGR